MYECALAPAKTSDATKSEDTCMMALRRDEMEREEQRGMIESK